MTRQSYGALAINHGSQRTALTVRVETSQTEPQMLMRLETPAAAVMSIKGGVERTGRHIRSAKQCFQKQHLQVGSRKKKVLDFTCEC